MSEYGVSQSALIRFMFNRFFNVDGWDFGVSGIRVSEGDDTFHMLAELLVFIADERAHEAVFNFIGSGGTLPCGSCGNIFGRCPPFKEEYLQRVSSTEYEQFDPRTENDYAEAARQLKATPDNGAGVTMIKKATSAWLKLGPRRDSMGRAGEIACQTAAIYIFGLSTMSLGLWVGWPISPQRDYFHSEKTQVYRRQHRRVDILHHRPEGGSR